MLAALDNLLDALEQSCSIFAAITNENGAYEQVVKGIVKKGPVKAGGPGSGRHKAFNDDGSINTTVSRHPGFAEPGGSHQGMYEVRIGNHYHQIFRSSDDATWYEDESTAGKTDDGGRKHYMDRVLGYSKNEAVNRLVIKHIKKGDLIAGGQGSGKYDHKRGFNSQLNKYGKPITNAIQKRALANAKPARKEEQDKGAKAEQMVTKSLHGESTPDHSAFDVIVGGHAFEVKALTNQANNKITMSSASMSRKLQFAKQNKMQAHTVALDMRSNFSNPTVYHRAGVGSFRIGNMDKVKGGLKGLQKHLGFN